MPDEKIKNLKFKIITADTLLGEEKEVPTKKVETLPPEKISQELKIVKIVEEKKEEPQKKKDESQPPSYIFHPQKLTFKKSELQEKIKKVEIEKEIFSGKKNLLIYVGSGVLIIIILTASFWGIRSLIRKTKNEEISQGPAGPTLVLPKVQVITSTPPLLNITASPTQEEITTSSETTTTSSLEIITTTTSKPNSSEETLPKKEEVIVSQPQAENLFLKQNLIFPTKDLSFTSVFRQKNIELNELNFDEFGKKLKQFLAFQESSGTLLNLNFTFNNQKIPLNFIVDYFLKVSKIPQEEFKKFKEEFTGNFALMVYYTLTRKYPILIFEIKDAGKVNLFNQKWEEKGMVDDLKTLFFGADRGEPLRNYFVTQNIGDFAYRVIYFENNYKLIWATTKNFLIYSLSEKALELIINELKISD